MATVGPPSQRMQASPLLPHAVVPTDATCDAVEALAAQHRAKAPRRAPVHPLVLSFAKKHLLQPDGTLGYVRHEGRLGSWANTTRMFHMTHIAKTGGRSVRLELSRLMRVVGGAEQCYPPFAHESRIGVVFVREPRGHALSQYLHGAYAGRAARRRAAGFPWVPGDDMAGFGRWISHFATGWTASKGDFYGYNPTNHMSRALTCTDERWNCDYLKECSAPCAHHVGANASDATPPLAAALAAVHAIDFVGVLELLPESLCVAEYRMRGTLSPACVCADADAASGAATEAAAPVRRHAHVMNSRRQRSAQKVTVAQAPASLLRQLDSITAVDARVYRAAVSRLMCDARALERATGKRVLCARRLEALRNKTAYVPGLWDGSAAGALASEWASARTYAGA